MGTPYPPRNADHPASRWRVGALEGAIVDTTRRPAAPEPHRDRTRARHTRTPPLPSRLWPRITVGAFAAGVILAVTACGTARSEDQPAGPSTALTSPTPVSTATDAVIAPVPVTDAELTALPQATTFTTLPAAPRDPAPTQPPSGRVVHPTVVVALYTAPGGPALAALPPKQLDSDTWLPVITERPGWAQVLLPTRPNAATAWLVLDSRIASAVTPYQLHVDRATFRMRLLRHGQQVNAWTVAVGKPTAQTPPGRTFVLASIREPHPTFSPIILPLGAHSDTYLSYGGGPGTVGIHTWPTSDVYGRASSDGCIRIPPDALQIISSDVPLGTPVLIS